MLKIDQEFKALIPALTTEEFAGLEQSVIAEGCRDALVVWRDVELQKPSYCKNCHLSSKFEWDCVDGQELYVCIECGHVHPSIELTIVDGHNRYEICTKHDIPYRTIVKEFDNREDVICWIINNQLGRRNLAEWVRYELMDKKEEIEKAKGKAIQLKTLKQNEISVKSIMDTTELPHNTRKIIANELGWSETKTARAKIIKDKAPEETKVKLRANEMTMNQAYEQITSKPHVIYNSGQNEWYTPNDYIDAAKAVMGEIDLDPASTEQANQVVGANLIYTAEDNGLTKDWTGKVWLNPPYAGELISLFCNKIASHFEAGEVTESIILVNNATETGWFNTLISSASAVVFPRSRVKFYAPDGTLAAPLQGQTVVYMGNSPDIFLEHFKPFGWGGKL